MAARRRRWVAIAVMVIGIVLGLSAVQGQQPLSNDEDLARQILAQVNDWRISEGLAPLRPNRVLQTLAEDQAQHIRGRLRSGPVVDFHVDAEGRSPRQRAVQLYGWPTYGLRDQIHIGENAAVGTVRTAMTYWRGSDVHRRAALSPVYREVGVAVLPTSDDDFLFMVVFGARPGVLPALYDPVDHALLLTDERSNYGPVAGSSLRVEVLDADGVRILSPQVWRARLDLPPEANGPVIVRYTAARYEALSLVDLARDRMIVADTLALLPAERLLVRGAFVPVPTASATPTSPPSAPTRTPTASATPFRFVLPSLTPTPSRTPTSSVTPTPSLTPTPVPLDQADLILTYNANGLTLRSARVPVNLTGLTLGTGQRSVSISAWTRVSAFPVDAFPRNHCLVVEQTGRSTTAPTECAFIRAQILLDANRVFWTAPFTVSRDGVPVGACSASPCAVDLP